MGYGTNHLDHATPEEAARRLAAGDAARMAEAASRDEAYSRHWEAKHLAEIEADKKAGKRVGAPLVRAAPTLEERVAALERWRDERQGKVDVTAPDESKVTNDDLLAVTRLSESAAKFLRRRLIVWHWVGADSPPPGDGTYLAAFCYFGSKYVAPCGFKGGAWVDDQCADPLSDQESVIAWAELPAFPTR